LLFLDLLCTTKWQPNGTCLKWKYHTPLLCSVPGNAYLHCNAVVYVDEKRSIIVMASRGGQESQALMNLLARVKEECKPAIYSAFIRLMNGYHGNM